jgi:S1-C subfamily serine protease
MYFSQTPHSKVIVVTFVVSVLASSMFGFMGGVLASDSAVHNAVFSALGLPLVASNSAVRVESTEEAQRVGVVRAVGPAVVSISVTKEMPKYEQYNADFFSPFFGQGFPVPGVRQNGTEKREIGAGSGFMVSEDGYIVTNKHVVSDEKAEYTVIMQDGRKFVAQVLARDPSNDVAILKIDAVGLPFVRLGNSDALQVGQSVIAIGYALGRFGNTVSTGILSGLERSIHAGANNGSSEDLFGVIQTDTAINPGNSGGPLLAMNGEVIGVNVAIVEGAQSIGFSLPINDVKRVFESVRNTGKISRPYMGIRYRMIDQALREKNQLPVANGALVVRGDLAEDLAVVPGSPADVAGVKENDIILEIHGKKLSEDYPLAAAVRQFDVGETVKMKVLRGGKEMEIAVTLAERQ